MFTRYYFLDYFFPNYFICYFFLMYPVFVSLFLFLYFPLSLEFLPIELWAQIKYKLQI